MTNWRKPAALVLAAAAGAVAVWWRRRKTRLSLRAFTQLSPKAELHVHLDGAFDLDVLHSWAVRVAPRLPESVVLPWSGAALRVRDRIIAALAGDATETACGPGRRFEALVTCPAEGPERDLFACLERFMLYLPIVRLGGAEALEELAEAFVRRQARDRVQFTELRYSPHEFLLAEARTVGADAADAATAAPAPMTSADVVDAVSRGLRNGEAACHARGAPMRVRQILCCIASRPDWSGTTRRLVVYALEDEAEACIPPPPPLRSDDVVALAASARGRAAGVVGVDIAAGEHHFPPAPRG